MLLAGLGCLDRVFESPYILVSGLGETRSLTIDRTGDLLAATSSGLWRVGADGTMERLDSTEVRAASISPRHRFRLSGTEVTWEEGSVTVPGAVDIAATWFDELWVLYPDRIEAIDTHARKRLIVGGLVDARAVALGGPQQMLVVTPSAVWSVDREGGRTPIVAGLTDARAAGADQRSRVYVVEGETLLRLDAAGPTLVARFLDDVRDLQFAAGPRLLPDFVYFATGEGRVDYLQVPP